MKTANKVGHCANCGSEHINYEDSELHDDMMAYNYTCQSCEETGKEWFKLEYIETIYYK